MVSDSDDTLAALEMQKAIDISQSCLGEPDDDLAQELERCRQQLEQSLRAQKKLEQQEAQNQALQLRLADAKEDAAAALGEIERLTEAEEARKKELEWHEQRAPDLAAASEGFLLLQERHNALAGQVDARIAEAKENGQRAEALERLNNIKEQTIAQLTTERQQACANLSGKIKELELEVDKIPELEMLVDQYRLEVSELQCALEEQKRAQEKLPPSSPTRVFVMGDGGCEGEIRDDKAWGTGQDKDRALASLKSRMKHKRRTRGGLASSRRSDEPAACEDAKTTTPRGEVVPDDEQAADQPDQEIEPVSPQQEPAPTTKREKEPGCQCAIM
eukprot:TRINITY_DN13942_c0_g1_i3.p1 TRINITY_DN13942_c0_g1~~TRINITY_DN13942_c0_g1_i3.p1  ORF type:complete len:332 (+),score=96.10 TRINITY_DN13942_c0_g1_i3:246-1241(+)